MLLSEWSGRRGRVYDFGVPVAGWPKKRELGPLSSWQGKLMQFVDPDRIEQSDRVQAASFALQQFSPWLYQYVLEQEDTEDTLLQSIQLSYEYQLGTLS